MTGVKGRHFMDCQCRKGWRVTGLWVERTRFWWVGSGPENRTGIPVGAVKTPAIKNGMGTIALFYWWKRQENQTIVLVGTVRTRHLLNGECGAGTWLTQSELVLVCMHVSTDL